jgi:hypothetical protein
MHLMTLLLLLAFPGWAQAADLAPDVQSAPRLAVTDAAAGRINTRLAALDADALATLADCVTGPDSEYSRDVTVTLDGPHYYALLFNDSGSCSGAAHPWSQTWPLIFDRATGAEVDPATWLPPAFAPVQGQGTGANPHLPANPALTEFYIAHQETTPYDDPECNEVLREDGPRFHIWPDGSAQGLVLLPVGLAYVYTPCENPLTIPLVVLQANHFAPELLEALIR